MNYNKDTREGYRDRERARKYKERLTSGFNWTRFTTWRTRACVQAALEMCRLTERDAVLDIPCGTGIMGETLCQFPASVMGSDISLEMMTLGLGEYDKRKAKGFVQADITTTPFKKGAFACVVNIALMHRLPGEIRRKALAEIATLSNRHLIVSYTIDSQINGVKQWVLKRLFPSHKPAPSAALFKDIIDEIHSNGLAVKKKFLIFPLLSSTVVLLLEKKPEVPAQAPVNG